MHTATTTRANDSWVDIEDLVCVGCDERVYPEAPQQDAVSADVRSATATGPRSAWTGAVGCVPVEAIP